MAEPIHNDEDLSEGRSGDNDHPTSPVPADVPSAEPHEATAHEPATLPGAVATVWSSILSTAYWRLGKRR
ncbi:hypothetical protein [Streptomyces mutabilis]|uniref:hypothetical protein n=1 Tax=Streptomyces mutabilis TaxID=67332 RepID=UPI003987B76A